MIGLNGAAILMFAHGISIALLFALAGEIRRRTGTLIFSDLGGLGKAMPFVGLTFGLATFAAIGLPGFANFAAEVMVFFGAFRVGADWHGFNLFQFATVLALWGVVISAVYMLRAYRAIFMGEMSPESFRGWNHLSDLSRVRRIPIILLVAVTLIVGCYPNAILRVLRPTFSARVVSPNR